MVAAVQRPRGPMGWSPEYAHLGWPGDTTPEQRARWRNQYEIESRATRETCLRPADIFGAPTCDPAPPQAHTSNQVTETLEAMIEDQAQAYADSKRQEIIKDLCAVMAGHGLDGTLQADNIARSAAGQIVQELAQQEAARRRRKIVDRMLSFADDEQPQIPQPRPVGGSR